ncbi:MAG: hypothetical protein HC781_03340 [Leptolyngbyaceae cyanobacterium CSU_1_4]|nr:hypothetical protein [Leptolyngbyaceae cyanobacterium CSU_1_4]
MSPKEELINAIEHSPDEWVRALLELIRGLQQQHELTPGRSISGTLQSALLEPEAATVEQVPGRLYRKQGILVIKTGALDGLDVNALIDEVREDRIQNQIGQVYS